jgi:hypothetical protein
MVFNHKSVTSTGQLQLWTNVRDTSFHGTSDDEDLVRWGDNFFGSISAGA